MAGTSLPCPCPDTLDPHMAGVSPRLRCYLPALQTQRLGLVRSQAVEQGIGDELSCL